MLPEFAGRTDPTQTPHPGTVTFVGPDGRPQTEPADRLPDWVKFAPGPDGAAVPVVRVVRVDAAHGHSVRSYSADGRLVGVMVPVTDTPPPRAVTLDRAPAAEPTGWF
ncbi:MAG: hypothetical protein K2X87_05145 [Gemmataceae bacterium]|nr:hypothetical protein [Gemmataceae bacterium]